MHPRTKNPKRTTIVGILANCQRFLVRWIMDSPGAEWIEDWCGDDLDEANEQMRDIAGWDVKRVQIVDQFTGRIMNQSTR